MYFESKVNIDPSQLTHIEKRPPTKVFRKILHQLTAGVVHDKYERETFTAVSILQQLNRSFLSSQVNNIVRLSHDDLDFYYDTEGKKDDLQEAFDKYDLEIDDSMSKFFEKLVMVLEHEDEDFKYLIEVYINRTHKAGIYPIEMKFSGFIKELKSNSSDDAKLKMESIFQSQETYNAYKLEKGNRFETFVDSIASEIRKHIKVDDVNIQHSSKLIVPKDKRVLKPGQKRLGETAGDYYGPHEHYYGFDDFLIYSMIWSSMCHDHHIHINNMIVEDEFGEPYGEINESGVDADSSFFDETSDVSQSEFDTISGNEESSFFESVFDSDSDSSWFDIGDFGGDSSCSSCSSCASCGGD